MYLFFDTETTGLPKNWHAPVSDINNWPRLVQLAWLLYDKNGQELSNGNYIIKPDGFTIPVEASRVHGITTERAHAEGEDVIKVLKTFAEEIDKTEHLVAHNISFDEKIAGAEFFRYRIPNNFFDKNQICTMYSTTNICKIPGNFGGYKWPKLSELHEYLFGTDFEDAHDALADVRATARCFFELKNIGHL